MILIDSSLRSESNDEPRLSPRFQMELLLTHPAPIVIGAPLYGAEFAFKGAPPRRDFAWLTPDSTSSLVPKKRLGQVLHFAQGNPASAVRRISCPLIELRSKFRPAKAGLNTLSSCCKLFHVKPQRGSKAHNFMFHVKQNHFPMQNLEKILFRISTFEVFPAISPSESIAALTSNEINSLPPPPEICSLALTRY